MGREGSLLSCRGFHLFPDRLIGGRDGGGLSTILSPGLMCGAWSPSLDGYLDLLTGEWWVGLAYAWGTSGASILGYPAVIHWFANRRRVGTTCPNSSTVVRTEDERWKFDCLPPA